MKERQIILLLREAANSLELSLSAKTQIEHDNHLKRFDECFTAIGNIHRKKIADHNTQIIYMPKQLAHG